MGTAESAKQEFEDKHAKIKAWIEEEGGCRLVRERITLDLFTAAGEYAGQMVTDKFYSTFYSTSCFHHLYLYLYVCVSLIFAKCFIV